MTAKLPASADTVIIGGGIIGCSTAYHLVKESKQNVVLLERSKITSGTTWHSAAMVRQLRSTPSLTTLAKYSAQLYQQLEAETGQSTGWINCGSLSIATNPDRLIHIQRQASLAKAFGIPVEEITREEIADLWPCAHTDDIIGGIYSPSDGRVGPSDLCSALVKGAKARGATFFEETPITNFQFTGDRITGVFVNEHLIECRNVVLAAGLWSREIAKLAGENVPLQACEHYALITHHFDGITPGMPILGDHDNHMYIRDEGGGLLVGCFEPNARSIDMSKLPSDFSFDLLAEDWDHFEPIVGGAIHRVPGLRDAEIKMLLNGPESFTLDNNFLLGAAPDTPGLFMCCGMNSVGMASGGGAGKALAEWIIQGEPTLDLVSVDARRFPQVRNSLKDLRERAPEVLSKHYVLHRLGNEWETARPGRMTPLYDRHMSAGACFGDRGGWERALWFDPQGKGTPYEPSFALPNWYNHVLDEQKATRDAVTLFDQTPLGKIIVQGKDCEDLLQRICSASMDIDTSIARYTLVLNERGGIECEWIVLRLAAERYMILTGSGQVTRDMNLLRARRTANEEAIATDITGSISVLSVMGPKSRDFLTALTEDDLSDAAFPFSTHREIEIAGIPVRAVRVSYVGELGWELHVSVDSAARLYDRMHGTIDSVNIVNAGAYALDALRLEKGICSFGHDIGPGDTPLEAGLGFAVKLDTDTPFVGREALKQQRHIGISRRRLQIALREPDELLLGGEPIYVNGELLGYTTSGAWSAQVGSAVGMGYISTKGLPIKELLTDAKVEVEIALKKHPAYTSLGPIPAKKLGRKLSAAE
ncbi:FAD-dependent oxidoreductase [Roseovarius pacificus]|uniref:GcvT family protein n=1 Tax=Roseovarius pacificus TaxID=337701 RepID=UPI002A18D2F4|nr:FAD-dependent oxidoreductase [Roseovarius pacificus]